MLEKIQYAYKRTLPFFYKSLARRDFLDEFYQIIFSQNINKRKQIMGELCKAHRAPFSIDQKKGYLVIPPEEFPLALEVANHYSKYIPERSHGPGVVEAGKRSYLWPLELAQNDIGMGSLAFKLALDPKILLAISEYFGYLPILSMMALFYSANDVFKEGGSQQFHFDAESTKQLKLFLMITDIDEESGPFSFLPRDHSKKLQHVFKDYHPKRFDDDLVYDIVGKENVVKATGKKGTILIVDTSQCIHYGSRPGKNHRVMMKFKYVSPSTVEWPYKMHELREYIDSTMSEYQRFTLSLTGGKRL